MRETTNSQVGSIWSATESRLVELRLQAFDEEWVFEWSLACLLYEERRG